MLPHYCPPNPPFSPRPDPSTTHDNPPAPSLPIPPYWASQVRVYLDGSVPAPIISQLEYFGAQIVKMGDRGLAGGIGGMFWRFLVASDPGVDRFIVRDSDSRLNPRERLAVEEWILSGLQARGRRWRVCRDGLGAGGGRSGLDGVGWVKGSWMGGCSAWHSIGSITTGSLTTVAGSQLARPPEPRPATQRRDVGREAERCIRHARDCAIMVE